MESQTSYRGPCKTPAKTPMERPLHSISDISVSNGIPLDPMSRSLSTWWRLRSNLSPAVAFGFSFERPAHRRGCNLSSEPLVRTGRRLGAHASRRRDVGFMQLYCHGSRGSDSRCIFGRFFSTKMRTGRTFLVSLLANLLVILLGNLLARGSLKALGPSKQFFNKSPEQILSLGVLPLEDRTPPSRRAFSDKLFGHEKARKRVK